MGGNTELFRKEGAALYLVDGDESVLLQQGEFVLLLVKHSCSPLAAVVAMVGDMQWPVGKDSLVSKLGETGFSFSKMPVRLRFALALDNLEKAETGKLEFLFEEYSTYMHPDHEAIGAANKFWTRIARVGGSIMGREDLDETTDFLAQKSDSMSPKLTQKMQQARRMSAVVKLFVRSVERGAINASTHVKKVDTDACGGGKAYRELALASVDAVAKVVEAVETAGRTLLDSTQLIGAGANRAEVKFGHAGGGKEGAVQPGLGAVSSLITSVWTLNKVGLRMLFQTIASINSTKSISHSLTQSSSEGSGGSFTSELGSLMSLSSKLSGTTADTNASQLQAAARSSGECLPSVLSDSANSGVQTGQSSMVVGDTGSAATAALPPSLPPRFYGTVVLPHVTCDRSGGAVTTALSLASGGNAGPPCFQGYRLPHAAPSTQPSQVFAPPPRRPPRPRSPFH